MRGDSGDLLKCPEEVERAESCAAGQGGEVMRRVGIVLNGPEDPGDTSDGARACAAGQAGLAAVQLDGMGREFDAQLFPGGSSGTGQIGRGLGDERGERADWRQTQGAESRIGVETVEAVGRIGKRDTAVACAVFVAAFKAAAGTAKHEGAGCEQFAAGVGTVEEAARGDDGDGDGGVPFFKGAIAGAQLADDLGDRPAVATGENLCLGWGDGGTGFHRNFRQDPAPSAALQH